jgi:hypothetical protein
MTTKTRTMNDITLTAEQIYLVKMTGQDFNINGSVRVDFLFFVDSIKETTFVKCPVQTAKNIRIAAKTFLA